MHAGIEDLLSLRDGEGDEATRAHVARCGACRAELARLEAVRDGLQGLPVAEPPAGSWGAIHRRLHQRQRGPWRAPLVGGLALAASVVLAVALVVRVDSPAPSGPNLLVQQSQQLERELRDMEGRGVMSGAEAQLIADLEDRIAVVDLQLSSGALSAEEAYRLWQRRVDLLMDLRTVKSDEYYLAETNNYVL